MNRKHKAGMGLMAVGVLLMAAAIFLLLHNRAEDREAGERVDNLMPKLRQEIAVRKSESEESLSFAISAEADMITDDTDVTREAEEKVQVDDYDYIGILSIPVLGLELPVMADWDYTRLKIAPCRYTGSADTDDLTIAAHNYSRHFGRLKNLTGGEEVIFMDIDGYRTSYIVVETEILEPTAIEEMIGSGYPLSLFTCTYGGKTRVTVRCDYK